MNNQLSIGFIGMSHLGITSAVAAAEKGWNVVCFDQEASLVSDLKVGLIPIVEPGLSSAIKRHRKAISFVSEPQELKKCDVAFIAMDVPTDDYGNSNLGSIKRLAAIVESNISKDAVLVVMCQVPPGFTRSLNHPESLLYYQVETLIYGQALERALRPERIIVGCNEPGQNIDGRLVRYFESFDCPVLSMRYESAELAKISINLFLAASVSVANTMSELCENLGADWNDIIPALNHDKRIGHYAYLRPGLGISGGNLERDLATVIDLAEITGSSTEVVRSLISDSVYRKDWAFRKLSEALNGDKTSRIAILGLAYKENTSSMKNSPSIALLSSLRESRLPLSITVFDPIVDIKNTSIKNVDSAKTALEACKGAEALVVMTPCSEFGSIVLRTLANVMKGNVVIDPYGVFDPYECEKFGLVHISLGRSETFR